MSNTAREGTSRGSSRKLSWSKKLGLLVLSICISVFIAEIALRVIGFSYPVTMQLDEHRGFAHRPGVVWTQKDEGFAEVKINRHGYRDKEWAVEKPAGTIRIAVLGDSYTDAVQVNREHRFTEVLQQHLTQTEKIAEEQLEVLNFGIRGHGTAQQLMTLRKDIWKFQPDIVLLAFLTGNDVRNNYKSLEQDPNRPYFVQGENGLKLDDTFQKRDASWSKRFGPLLCDYSRLAQLAYRFHHTLKQKQQLHQTANASSLQQSLSKHKLQEPGIDPAIYLPPEQIQEGGKEWEHAWQVTENILAQMQQECTEHDADFMLVTLSNGIQVHPDQQTRRQFQEVVGTNDLYYPDQRLRQIGQKHGFNVLTLAEPMGRYASLNQKYLHGFHNTKLGAGHWNEDGHRVAGILISKWLSQALPTKPTLSASRPQREIH